MLNGALATVNAISGLVPIVHSNPGCGVQGFAAGFSDGTGLGGARILCSDVSERHIIFGGASRLREELKNAARVVNAEAFIVLNGCEAAMVADDIASMTEEAREQGISVIFSGSTGFHGGAHTGYESVLTELLKEFSEGALRERTEEDGLSVNIFGVLPGRSAHARGDLNRIEDILAPYAIRANTFFYRKEGISELKRSGRAALSLVFSKWGEKPARYLAEHFQIPCLTMPCVPSGAEEVAKLKQSILEKLRIGTEGGCCPDDRTNRIRERYYENLQGIRELYYTEGLNRRAAVVGDEAEAVQAATVLSTILNMEIATMIITDGDTDHPVGKVPYELSQEVVVTEDERMIEEHIEKKQG